VVVLAGVAFVALVRARRGATPVIG
jgi:hypothetical protein